MTIAVTTTRTVSQDHLRHLTHASEFATSCVRSIAFGHDPASWHATDPAMWAMGELKEFLQSVGVEVELSFKRRVAVPEGRPLPRAD